MAIIGTVASKINNHNETKRKKILCPKCIQNKIDYCSFICHPWMTFCQYLYKCTIYYIQHYLHNIFNVVFRFCWVYEKCDFFVVVAIAVHEYITLLLSLSIICATPTVCLVNFRMIEWWNACHAQGVAHHSKDSLSLLLLHHLYRKYELLLIFSMLVYCADEQLHYRNDTIYETRLHSLWTLFITK